MRFRRPRLASGPPPGQIVRRSSPFWSCCACGRRFQSCNLGVSGSCLLMVLLCPGTPGLTGLELFLGPEPRRSVSSW